MSVFHYIVVKHYRPGDYSETRIIRLSTDTFLHEIMYIHNILGFLIVNSTGEPSSFYIYNNFS